MLRQFRMHAGGCRLGEQVQHVRVRGGEGACGQFSEGAEDDPLSRRRRVHDLRRGDEEVSEAVSAGDVVSSWRMRLRERPFRSPDGAPRNPGYAVVKPEAFTPRRAAQFVARMERSAIRGNPKKEPNPDYASLHPGYAVV